MTPEAGADVNACAGRDDHRRGGRTALFRTVSSNSNHSRPVLELLLAAGARTDTCIASIVWCRGFDWETTLFSVTPLSSCLAGLLPSMHRSEAQTHANLGRLLASGGRRVPPLDDAPNVYVHPPQRD